MRNFRSGKGGVVLRNDLLTFRKLYVVDIIHRQHSYILPKSFDRILPFLSAVKNCSAINRENGCFRQYDKVRDESWAKTLDYDFTKESTQSSSTEDVVDVVYLDRSIQTWPNSTIYRSYSKLNGREVENRDQLLRAIKASLKPKYRLVIHTCVDWKLDRIVLANAKVILGPHGGHFTSKLS